MVTICLRYLLLHTVLLHLTSTAMATSSTSSLLPTIFLAHGGGPLPLIGRSPEIAKFLSDLFDTIGLSGSRKLEVKAALIVTAHWEESVITVSNGEKHSLLFDYYNFPPETYKYTYDAPGSPSVANKVTKLLEDAGIPYATDAQRGWDHGVFVPMILIAPEADIPVVQVSLASSLDPQLHIRIGQALAPLRAEGVLILGSGYSFHNLPALFAGKGKEESKAFDKWLQETCTKVPADEREKRLSKWYDAPHARFCHPREEHLLPLHVCVGAAGVDRGRTIYSDEGNLGGPAVSAFEFAPESSDEQDKGTGEC